MSRAFGASLLAHGLVFALLSGSMGIFSPPSGGGPSPSATSNRGRIIAMIASPSVAANESDSANEDIQTQAKSDEPPSSGASGHGLGMPKLEQDFAPNYPIHLLASGIRGNVSIKFRISKFGKVADAQLLDSSPPGQFDDSALEALAKARFVLSKGSPDRWFIVTIRYDPFGLSADAEISPIQ